MQIFTNSILILDRINVIFIYMDMGLLMIMILLMIVIKPLVKFGQKTGLFARSQKDFHQPINLRMLQQEVNMAIPHIVLCLIYLSIIRISFMSKILDVSIPNVLTVKFIYRLVIQFYYVMIKMRFYRPLLVFQGL